MTRKIVRRPAANRDLAEIALYIGKDNPDAALRFLDAAEATYKILAIRGPLGEVYRFRNPKVGRVRRWPVEGFQNWLVFYQETKERIEIFRVIHGAQDWMTILGQSK